MADYVVTEAGGFQMPTATRSAPAGDRRREGLVLVPDHGARHARPRVAAVPHRQRARDRGRDRAAPRRVPSRPRRSTTRGGASSKASTSGPSGTRHLLDEATPRRVLRDAADRARPPGARVHAHDVRADDHPRRHEDQRDPRHGSTSRSTSARCPASAPPTSASMLDDALGDLAAHVEITPFDENESTVVAGRHAAVGRDGPGLVSASSRAPRSCRSSPSARPTRGSSGATGSVAYGFGLFSRKLSFDDYASMFHGNDERVDIESLVLSTRLWDGLARDLVEPHQRVGCPTRRDFGAPWTAVVGGVIPRAGRGGSARSLRRVTRPTAGRPRRASPRRRRRRRPRSRRRCRASRLGVGRSS